jgi:hypothetical protein
MFVVLAGHLFNVWRLVDRGRGSYLKAIATMTETKPPHPGTIRIGTDHDFRHQTVLKYYWPVGAGGLQLAFAPATEPWGPDGVDWALLQSQDPRGKPVPAFHDSGTSYELVSEYPSNGLSGGSLAVYRNTGRRLTPGVVSNVPGRGEATYTYWRREAVGYLRQAVRQSPQDATLHYFLSIALSACGQKREAQAHLEESKRLQR